MLDFVDNRFVRVVLRTVVSAGRINPSRFAHLERPEALPDGIGRDLSRTIAPIIGPIS